MSEHEHDWRTRYTTIDQVDCASGMECECGAVIDQLDVEDAINEGRMREALQGLYNMVNYALDARDALLISKTCATMDKAREALRLEEPPRLPPVVPKD